jgi:hypothetical protein
LPLSGPGHDAHAAPQWAGSLTVSKQVVVVPQAEKPGAQFAPQTPAVHAGEPFAIAGQTPEQLAQCAGSLCVSVSQPFVGLPSQSANPPLQPPVVHFPLTQVGVPFCDEQGWLQPPQ